MAKTRTIETVQYGIGSISANGASIIDQVFPTPDAVVMAAKLAGASRVTVEKRTRTEMQELFGFADGVKFKTTRKDYSPWLRVAAVDL